MSKNNSNLGGLTVLYSGNGPFYIFPGTTVTIFKSCCSRSIGTNLLGSEFCNFQIYYSTITVTNEPITPCPAIPSTTKCFTSFAPPGCNNICPAQSLIVTPIAEGRPLSLDCSLLGIPIETANSKTVNLAALFDQIDITYPPPTNNPGATFPAQGSYFLSIGICPS